MASNAESPVTVTDSGDRPSSSHSTRSDGEALWKTLKISREIERVRDQLKTAQAIREQKTGFMERPDLKMMDETFLSADRAIDNLTKALQPSDNVQSAIGTEFSDSQKLLSVISESIEKLTALLCTRETAAEPSAADPVLEDNKMPPTYEESESDAIPVRGVIADVALGAVPDHTTNTIRSDLPAVFELDGGPVYEMPAASPASVLSSPTFTYIPYRPGMVSASMPELQSAAYAVTAESSARKKPLVGRARSRHWLQHQASGT